MTVENRERAATAVDAVLERSGLSVTEEQRAALVELYPQILALLQRLRLPEARYAEPAVVFSAASPPGELATDDRGPLTADR